MTVAGSASAQPKFVIGNTSALAPGARQTTQTYDVSCSTEQYALSLDRRKPAAWYSSGSVKDVDLSGSPLADLLLDTSLIGNLHFVCSANGLGFHFYGFKKTPESGIETVTYYGHISKSGAPTVEIPLRGIAPSDVR